MKQSIARTIAHRMKKFSRRNIYPFLESHLRQLPVNSVVLNVGAGGGHDEVVRRIGDERNFIVESSDIDPERRPDIVDDICASSLPSESFDAVVLAEVLEHVRQPFNAVSEIIRILKPGGTVLVTVPFFFPIHDRPNDYFRYTEYGLRMMFSQLELVEIQRRDTWFEALLLAAARIGFERGKARRLAIVVVPICALLYPVASMIGAGADHITSGYMLRGVKAR